MIPALRKQAVGNRLPTFLTILFVLLEVAMDVTIPYLMANLLDRGISGASMREIIFWGAILLLCSFVALAFGILSGHFAARASTGFARNVRKSLYHKIQEFSFANLDRLPSSSLVTRLTTDVTNVQMAYQMLTRIAVRSPAMLFFSFFMAYTINASLSLVFLVAIPTLALGLFLLIRAAYPIFTKVFKTYDRLNTVVQENIRSIRVVKSFVREEHEIEKFNGVNTEIYKQFSKAEKIIAFNSPLMQGTMYISILVISYIGAKLITSSSMTTGQLMSFITYTSQILMSLMFLSMVVVMLTISRAAIQRIEEVLKEESDITEKADAVTTVKDGSIIFDDVSFSYTNQADKLNLEGITLDIPSGSTVGILGPTGSGKSSLIQLLARLYDVYSGSVKIGGVDVRDYSIRSLRDQVGVVLQKNTLFSGTVAENLRWGNEDASQEELIRVAKIAQAHPFIDELEEKYDSVVEQGGTNFSGGQRQRLAIARALLKRPKILILDDSTSAVDTKTEASIRAALKNELKETTKIIIAQRIGSVIDADQIIMLEDGKIHAVGNHETLLGSCARYQEMYASQMRKEERA
ncbi:MAG TPA: ABC transporter ATP-binding protein [Sphaerochaeta sp.]|nr:ABC transporter ATP-binding protein [Sphaerochaeta sp.]